jgi:hypothetical protein
MVAVKNTSGPAGIPNSVGPSATYAADWGARLFGGSPRVSAALVECGRRTSIYVSFAGTLDFLENIGGLLCPDKRLRVMMVLGDVIAFFAINGRSSQSSTAIVAWVYDGSPRETENNLRQGPSKRRTEVRVFTLKWLQDPPCGAAF